MRSTVLVLCVMLVNCLVVTSVAQTTAGTRALGKTWPIDMDLLGRGGTPTTRVSRWMKYAITIPPNHPFRIVFFSTQKFRTTGYETDVLLVLSRREYDLLDSFTRSRQCDEAARPPAGGMIMAYRGRHLRACWLAQDTACDYLTAISTLPGINWTPAQIGIIHGQSWDTQCKDSGWWEYQEKFRQEAEDSAKSRSTEGAREK